MKILLTGASGLVGTALTTHLESKGYEVVALDRKASDFSVENFYAVIHLAGKSIADGRWTDEVKKEIYDSRIQLTQKLSAKISLAKSKPKVFISASAIGFYGDRGDELLDENSASSENGFLPKVCRDWEAAAKPAQTEGVRVVHPRFGVILSGEGGALKKMLTPFKWGVGSPLGSGDQWMSWISLRDVVLGIEFLLTNFDLSEAVNFVSPSPVINLEFSKTLAHLLNRPLGPKVPAFMLKVLFGEMAEELLLSSAKVLPKKLESAGFKFSGIDLAQVLKNSLQV
ncbi:MAG: TIGR01777 family oxidoreductase [Deltaproteobacteria bacterium]|nr:TIGR01777 family oxidoreductase [Deltaproteobacteria bacterium]